MKKLLGSFSAAALTLACSGAALADAKIESTVTITPESQLTEQEQQSVKLAAARLLVHVDQARADLKKKDTEAATKNVSQALLLAGIIKSAMPSYKIKSEVKSGSKDYVDESVVKPLLVTVEDNLDAIAVIEPVRLAKRQAHRRAGHLAESMTDLELAESRAQLDVNQAAEQLTEAKSALEGNKAELADNYLNRVLTDDVDFQYGLADLPLGGNGAARKSAKRAASSKSKPSAKVTSSAVIEKTAE